MKKKGLPVLCEAYVILTDNDGIRTINKEHRGIDEPTDVLSFPMIEYSYGEPCIEPGDIDPDTGRVFLGDIVISVDKALEQAQKYGHSQNREFAFLAVHGALHLLDYDHESKEDEKIMFSIQEDILEEMGLPAT